MEAADILDELDFNESGEEEDGKSSFYEELLFGVEGTQQAQLMALRLSEIKYYFIMPPRHHEYDILGPRFNRIYLLFSYEKENQLWIINFFFFKGLLFFLV